MTETPNTENEGTGGPSELSAGLGSRFHWTDVEMELGATGRDDLAEWCSQEVARLQDYRNLYNELVMAVGLKRPGENRHETALRYIRRMEEPSECVAVMPNV